MTIPDAIPWAVKVGDPHLHKCACGHEWVAPLDPSTNSTCPSCTDANGHNVLDRQIIAIARAAIERFGIDVVLATAASAGGRQTRMREEP